MASLLEGGAVEAVIGEVLKAALETIDKGRDFKPTLESNKDTLRALAPLVEEIKRYSKDLNRPKEELARLEFEMRKSEELVNKCSKFRWWRFFSFPRYQEKLRARDESLVRNLSVNMQTQMARDSMETLSKVREILEILSEEYVGVGNHGPLLLMGLSGSPEKPEFTVGLDEPLRKLKIEVLKGGDGASVTVLTGLGGSGKSTLAKMLCWDDQVKGKFGGNIFFVTVSKTPNLKTIVLTLYKHCGCRVPEFQSDEDAISLLGFLLRQVGRTPILLVLDDVWPGSEALLEKFKFQISDYKILVTSRVVFPGIGTPCHLKPLDHDDAIALFRHFAKLNISSSYMPDENLVHEIVRGCKGSPLALEVIGGSLCHQPFEVWETMKERLKSQSIIESNTDLLSHLQNSLDILEDAFSKECFMDLGLFPEDQRIHVPALIDMWEELYKLDEDGKQAMTIIHNLASRNLVNVIVTRKVAMDEDIYYNNHFLVQHDLLRELAIHQSSQEPFGQRKRLIIDLSGNNRPEWWVSQSQQGIISHILSFLPIWWIKQKQTQKQVIASIMSISTDEAFSSDWYNMQPDEVEVMVLNLRSSHYSLPEFIEKMNKLKVLIVLNYGFHPSKFNKFELLGSLPDLKRLRLERVSVPSLCKLNNLRKLSLHMCNTRQAFESSSIQISNALPNLVELDIDYCSDLVQLPSGLCEITSLKKLSITNCHKLSALPQEIGKLENLELLRLISCSDLLDMPESVGKLHNLSCLDITECISLTCLPEDIGELHSLEKLYVWGCSRLSELPSSAVKFEHLKHVLHVICDEEIAALWEQLTCSLPNIRIVIPKADISLNWLPGVRSRDFV